MSLSGTLHIVTLKMPFDDGIQLVPLVAQSVSGGFDRIIVATPSARSLYQVSIVDAEVRIMPATLSASTYAEWSDGIDNLTGSPLGTEASDPDGDGISNLMEYAFDLNPWVRSGSPVEFAYVPNPTGNLDRVRVRFPWAEDMADLSYTVQGSSDLSIWTDLEGNLVDSIDDGSRNLITLEVPVDLQSGLPAFLRLGVE